MQLIQAFAKMWFTEAMEAWKSRQPDGKNKSDMLEAIALFGVDVTARGSTEEDSEKNKDDERFLRELRALYAAPDKDAVRAVLTAVVMPADFSTV